MYDKSKWKTVVEKHGNIIAVHFTGGGECLWLNMYLDTEDWQMTCDSDIEMCIRDSALPVAYIPAGHAYRAG